MSVSAGEFCIGEGATIREAIETIDRAGAGIALVVDDAGRLIGTVSDGDVRRAVLHRTSLDDPVENLLRVDRPRGAPLTAPAGTPADELLHLMSEHVLRQVPLVDPDGKVVGVALLEELVKEYELPLRAVVMAGGYGRRLGELTDSTPKPMLHVGDQPLLERIVGQLREAGIRRVHLTTHYRAEAITSHFGDGQNLGVELRYVNEEEPLGTAGALGLIEPSNEPILVMNGDIVTRIDFRALLRFHEEHDAAATVAVRPYEVRVRYGVVETEGAHVVAIEEKPIVDGFVNAGIYLLEPHVVSLVPKGSAYDMPDLIRRVLDAGGRVCAFPLREYWVDIGEPTDYRQAVSDHGLGS